MHFKLLSRTLAFFLFSAWGVVSTVKGQEPSFGYRVFIDNLMLDQTLNLNELNGTSPLPVFSKLIYEKSKDGYHLYDLTLKADFDASSSVKLSFETVYKTSIKTLSLPVEITENGPFFQWLTSYQNQIIAEDKEDPDKPASAFDKKVVFFSCSSTEFKTYYKSQLKWRTRKNGLFLNLTLGVSRTRRTLQVENPQFRNTEALTERTNGESGLNAFPFSFGLGYQHGNHQISIVGEYATFGISASRPIHNTTGLPTDATDTNSSKLRYFLIMGGLTYAYSQFRPGLSPYFQTGLQVGQVSHQDFIVSKTGFGISYKPRSELAIKAYPFIQWDLTKIKRTEISTQFYNYGLELGVSWFPHF